MVRQFFILTCAILWAAPLAAQTREPDPPEVMVRKFERALNAGDRAGLRALFASSVPESQIEQYTNDLLDHRRGANHASRACTRAARGRTARRRLHA